MSTTPDVSRDSRVARVARVALLALALAASAASAQSPSAPPPAVPFRPLADSLLDDPIFRSAHWGVLVVDPASGDTLYSRNAGKLFMPASNQKLITGAIALATLGPEFRFTTRILGGAYPIDGILTGDLVVVGSGDPFSPDSVAGTDAMDAFVAIADSLAARGIRDVTGRLIRGADIFPDSALGAGWAWDDLDFGYSAPADELTFNDGYARVMIVGAPRPGGQVEVSVSPARTVPRLGAVEVTTGMRCCMERSRVEAFVDVSGKRPVMNLRGTVRAGDTLRLDVALRDPAGAWLDAMQEALAERGIRVRGGVESNALADTTGLTTLATHRSPPLPEILARFEKASQNQVGELLYKTIALAVTGVGTADSARRVYERQLVAWGADSAGFAIRDGSGLSRHDYLTPETIVRVLDVMRRHPEFAVFYQSLPVAGVDGTLTERLRGTAAEGNVRAKTGTLDKARSLSGYVTTADGRMLLFAMLVNNQVAASRDVERVMDALALSLASSSR